MGTLAEKYFSIRNFSEEIVRELAQDDFCLQTMADVSPPKWHLAHVTWFFENFILQPRLPRYRQFDQSGVFHFLFNSYYESQGERQDRPLRGWISRPSTDEVFQYRRFVDDAMFTLMSSDECIASEIESIIEIGLQHEQQHQELLITDIKYNLSHQVYDSAYRRNSRSLSQGVQSESLSWVKIDEQICSMGFQGDGFCFDNEKQSHQVFQPESSLANRLATNGEYLEFMNDGGYTNHNLWLADGWALKNKNGWQSPLYWLQSGGVWVTHTVAGLQELNLANPVSHVSYYEADAFARWAGCQLPTEVEWEIVAGRQGWIDGNFIENDCWEPQVGVAKKNSSFLQLYGDLWEWTRSPYLPYPGFQPLAGALGEYNGKFMCNQFVLRGGSCVTSRTHIRKTYRNFFPPSARWQYSGIRLAGKTKYA